MNKDNIGKLYKITCDSAGFFPCIDASCYTKHDKIIKINKNDILIFLQAKTLDIIDTKSLGNSMIAMYIFLHKNKKICYPTGINFESFFEEIK